MTNLKRVAVIGGGPMGLGVIKSSKEEGLEPVCFEKTGYVGGLWRYHDDDVDGVASVMNSTIINTSKEVGAVSNFPPPAEFPNFMHHTLMYEYLKIVAKKFDCLRHVKYYHETEKIEKADDYEETGRWKVTNRNTQTGKVMTEVFDCVAVCIGHHVYPNIPVFPNQDKFEGKCTHTHSLKKVNGFEGQRVVVVGVGNSGLDAAVELSSVTKQVYLSSRRGNWVLSRVGRKGYPIDYIYIRRYWDFLRSLVPDEIVNFVIKKIVNERFDHSLYNLKPKHQFFGQHPTISDCLPIKLLSGVVKVRSVIKQFTKKGVIFEGDENETEVDTVILATGYQIKFPFLSDDVLRVVDNKVQLYKHIYPSHLPYPTLAILGLFQSFDPGIPVGEMQSRWVARIMSGKHKLPTEDKMLQDIKLKEALNRKRYVDSPRHTVQVDVIPYQDELAKDIGVKPNLLKLAFTDPKLFWEIFFGPGVPYQYRLQGPHSWTGARDAILTCKERTVKPLQNPNHSPSYVNNNLLKVQIIRILFLLPFLYFLVYFII